MPALCDIQTCYTANKHMYMYHVRYRTPNSQTLSGLDFDFPWSFFQDQVLWYSWTPNSNNMAISPRVAVIGI